MRTMVNDGDKVRIDLDAWNNWRVSEGLNPLPRSWIKSTYTVARMVRGRDAGGRSYSGVHIGGYIRNCPCDLLMPVRLDKTTISQMLVRMQ